nr:MAG TPA: hypothetical protein [Caudoviricetes sp.]
MMDGETVSEKSWEGGLVVLDVAACFMILGLLLVVEIFKNF